MPDQPRPDWVPVVSSNVEAVRWVGGQWLDVRFKAKGKRPAVTYRYYGATVDVYHAMLAAPSKGQFVWQELRDKYEYARLG